LEKENAALKQEIRSVTRENKKLIAEKEVLSDKLKASNAKFAY